MKITGLGAGYVVGPKMALIAAKCPDVEVAVVDPNAARIAALNSDSLPVYQPVLDEVVRSARGRNLHFHTDVESAISSGDIIFVCADTPAKTYGAGNSRAAKLLYIESAARMIAELADGPKIMVEKSTINVRTAAKRLEIRRERPPQPWASRSGRLQSGAGQLPLAMRRRARLTAMAFPVRLGAD